MEYTTSVVKIGNHIVRVDNIREVHMERNMDEAYILCFDLYEGDSLCVNYGHTCDSKCKCKEGFDEIYQIMGGK